MAALSRLVGRAEELDELERLARDHRLVTITGPGGVGKTRLATELRSRLDRAGTRVVTARLGHLPTNAGAEAVMAETGFASPEALALAVADEHAVLVLDACEHVLPAAVEAVTRFLDATESGAALVTSRQPLGIPGERVLVLDPLAVPALGDPDPASATAVELFVELAAAAGARWDRSDETLELVAELCRVIDGLPLAIELAAARARTLGPAELLALVTKHVDALRSPHDPQQSVRAAIRLSVDLLDDDQCELFRRLGALVGPFDLGLVHAVAGPAVDDHLRAVELVGALVERSLVVADATRSSTRYRMLELVREHAAAELVEHGQWEETRERLAQAMVEEATAVLVEGSQRWSGDLVARITTRTSSFVSSIDWCIEHDTDPARAFTLFVPLYAPAMQRAAEIAAVGQRLFGRWPDERAAMRAESLAVFATALVLGRRFDEATPIAEAALADPDGTAIAAVVAERCLTLAAIGRDDHATALVHARRGQEAAARVPLPPFERELRGFEAELFDRTGAPEDAVRLAEEVVAESIAAADPITEIWGRLVAAMIAVRDGRLAEARSHVEAAGATARTIDETWWGGPIFRARAVLAAHEAAAGGGDGWTSSQHVWRGAIERAARLGDLTELTLTLLTAAAAAAQDGHDTAAQALLAASPGSPAFTVLPEVYEHRRRMPGPGAPPPDRAGIVRAVRAALAAMDDEPAVAAPRPPSTASAMRRDGDGWSFTFGGTTVRLRDLKGFGDIAVLLQRPGEDVHCLELMGASDVGSGAGPILDDKAKRAYQQRIVELQGDIDDARDANDIARAERAEVELDALVSELTNAFGLGGRARSTGSAVERARSAVTYRIRAAVKKVTEHHPELGRHLAHSVRTGTWCAYRPEHDVRWTVG